MIPRILYFDLSDTLLDRAAYAPKFAAALAETLVHECGGTPAVWRAAWARVLADWDSYYADLNLSGDEGIAAMWEGMFRTMRALFRLAGAAEPLKHTLTELARTLPGRAARRIDALYADAAPVLARLAPVCGLGVSAYFPADHTRGILEGGGALAYFDAPILTPETAERFERDSDYFLLAARRANAAPADCLLISADVRALAAAESAGLRVAPIDRTNTEGGTGVLSGVAALADALIGSAR